MNEEEELEFDEFRRKKRGSGKTPSSSNPKGAGRPTKEWEEYREFLEWKRLKSEGITPRGWPEIFRGFARPGDGRGEGDSRRDTPRFMGRVLQAIGFKEKDIQKIGIEKLDREIVKTAKWFEPYVMPSLGKPIGILLGLTGWYMLEEIPVKETLDQDVWEEMPESVRDNYYDIVYLDNGQVTAKRKIMYPILHTAVEVLKWLIDVVGGIADESFNVGGYNPISYFKWLNEKPARWLMGGAGVWVYMIQKRKKKVKEN